MTEPAEPTPTPLDSLLHHRGVPVPWIARWTSEVVTPKPAFQMWLTGMGVRVGYRDERPSDRINETLWIREHDSQGVGEPQFAVVHSHRQRACQLEGRCQVCGRVIDERPIPWLVPKILLARNAMGSIVTDVAPTCAGCLGLAKASCPHLLSKPSTLFYVKDWRPTALFGDVIDLARGVPLPPMDAPYVLPRSTMIRHYQATAPVNGYTGNVMARQVVVELWNYRRAA